MYKIPLFKLNYDEKEKIAVEKVISTHWLTMGEKTLELEKKFSKFLGNKNKCIAVSSCTAAIHLSLLAANVKSNDEVIVPSLSFVAQINIIKNIGAKPILIDCCSLDNWNMNTSLIVKSITRKTKAIIILHYAGYPCLITEELRSLCTKKNIIIIEDVAHAPGAEFNKKKCGTLGDIACFSFFSNKNISAGEGGIIATNNQELEKKVRYMRSHGMTTLSLDKVKGRSANYDVLYPGLNYRIDEMRSALAIVQLNKLKKANSLRKKHTNLYIKLLNNTEIKLPFLNEKNSIKSAYHILPILLPKNINREKVMKELQELGVQTSIHYPAFWSFSIYKNLFNKNNYPICEEICKRQITLPLFPNMKAEDINLVCKKLLRAIS